MKMSISIDGFVGGPDGGIKWVLDIDREATAWTVETVPVHKRVYQGPIRI